MTPLRDENDDISDQDREIVRSLFRLASRDVAEQQPDGDETALADQHEANLLRLAAKAGYDLRTKIEEDNDG